MFGRSLVSSRLDRANLRLLKWASFCKSVLDRSKPWARTVAARLHGKRTVNLVQANNLISMSFHGIFQAHLK